MLEKIEDITFVYIQRIVESSRGPCNLRGEDQEQHDVRDVHLSDPLPESLDRCQEQPAPNDRRIDPADEIAGNKDEELGGVAEAVLSQCEPRHDILRDVIEEAHP